MGRTVCPPQGLRALSDDLQRRYALRRRRAKLIDWVEFQARSCTRGERLIGRLRLEPGRGEVLACQEPENGVDCHAVCWGATDCEAHAVDWRARALAAEKEVRILQQRLVGVIATALMAGGRW